MFIDTCQEADESKQKEEPADYQEEILPESKGWLAKEADGNRAKLLGKEGPSAPGIEIYISFYHTCSLFYFMHLGCGK